MALPARTVDWQPLRDAYCQRAQRPSYEELSAEFAVATPSIYRTSADEGWPALRNAWLESQVKEADAHSIILAAVKGDRAVGQAYLSLAIVTLATLQGIVESVDATKAPATRAEAVNTAMFAAKNLADALKSVGMVGVARAINAAGDAGNGRWDPAMLSQINQQISITLQTGKGEAAMPAQVTQVETPGIQPAT